MADEGGGKGKLILIIVVLLVLVGGGAAAFFMLGGQPEEGAQTEEEAPKIEEDFSSSSQQDPSQLANPKFTPPQEYSINLRDGKHFLKLELVAVLEDEAALQYIATRKPLIDDMVITYLGNLRTEDVRNSANREVLKRELFKKINSVFSQEFIDDSETGDRMPVKKVLITKFILQ